MTSPVMAATDGFLAADDQNRDAKLLSGNQNDHSHGQTKKEVTEVPSKISVTTSIAK